MAADDDIGEDQGGERRGDQQPAQDREGLEAGAAQLADAADVVDVRVLVAGRRVRKREPGQEQNRQQEEDRREPI